MKLLILQDRLRGGGTEKHTLLLANCCHDAQTPVLVVLFRPGGHLFADLQAPHRILQPIDCGLNFLAPGLVRAVRQFAPTTILAMGRMANHKLTLLRRVFPAALLIGTARSGRPFGGACLRGLAAADRVLVNSHWMETRLRQMGLQHPDLRRIPNCIGRLPSIPSPRERRQLRARLGAGADTVVWLHAGRFRPGKGQRELIEAVALLPRSVDGLLCLLGDGPKMKACRRHARKLGIAHRVYFAGYQNDPAPFLAAADVAVCASRSESLPNFLIEAQAAGLPVVAWNHAGVGETFAPGKSGVLTPEGDLPAFAHALQQLSQSPDRRSALAREASGFARHHFDSSKIIRQYLDALQ